MSSTCEANTSRTPATGTKRRYLGSARRKRVNEIFMLSPGICSKQQENHVQVCSDENPSVTEEEPNIPRESEHGETASTRKKPHEQPEPDSIHTPAHKAQTCQRSRLFKRHRSHESEKPVQADVVDTNVGMGMTSSSSSTNLLSTPVHRIQVRYMHSGRHSARKRPRNDDFKSPVRNQVESTQPLETVESLTKGVEQLQQTANELQVEIVALTNEGYREEELQTHIEKMHEYNELKDTGQMLLGKIALVKGVTTKDLYEQFSLDLSD